MATEAGRAAALEAGQTGGALPTVTEAVGEGGDGGGMAPGTRPGDEKSESGGGAENWLQVLCCVGYGGCYMK